MHVYLFSPIPYSFLHQRPQQIADKIISSGIPVTYIEPRGFTEYRAGGRKGLLRMVLVSVTYHVLAVLAIVLARFRGKTDPPRHRHRNDGGLEIISMPLVLPINRFNLAFLERLNASVYRQVLRRRVFRGMTENETTIAIVEHPFWGSVLEKRDFHCICYDCIDELSLFAGRASVQRFVGYENMLLSMSDAIFATARKLEESLRLRRPSGPIYRITNGVDYEWFQERAGEGPLLSDIKGVKKPVVGYAGILRSWTDYELIGLLAEEFPEVSFVFVGPLDYERRISELRARRNISWLGRKEYRDVPVYINAFDVCIIPFQTGKVAETTNPVKLYEYFALGKPVVSTWLTELEEYRHRELLYMVKTRDEFAGALREALEENDPTKCEERRRIAREHSWSAIVTKMLSVAVEIRR